MFKRWIHLLQTALLALPLIVHAEDAYYAPRYPWHSVDIWWTCAAQSAELREISVDFRIIGRVDDSIDLFVAPLGLFRINGTSFYGGLQTSADGWPSKDARTKSLIGRGGIFSRWSVDNQPIALSYADGWPGTHYESADFEKNFISVRRKVDWGEGDYTFQVRRLPQSPGSAVAHAWFGAFVIERATGKETPVGSLRLDGSRFLVDRSMAAFVEVYRRSRIPRVSVAFSEPEVNAQPCASSSIKALYPKYGLANSPRFATATVLGNVTIVTTIPAGTQDKIAEEILR